MSFPCPVCAKSYVSKNAFENHTGTSDPAQRKPHACSIKKCKKTFCSQKAMKQHRDGPTHATMPTAAAAGTQPNGQVAGATTSALRGEPVAASTVFKCGACSKEFGSKKARQQHKKSVRHKTASAGTAVVGPGAATPGRNTGRVPSAPTTTRSIAATHSSVLGVDSTIDRYHADDDELDGSDPESDDSDDSDDRASRDLQWHGGSFGNDDQDWSVCDKDCGWCGHCADGLDI